MKSRLIVSDGREQKQRQLPALRGDYFQPNELRFEQLLTLASEYARLVRFYQLDLQADGDWHQYFKVDETVLLASIIALDSNELSANFENRLRQSPNFQNWPSKDIGFRLHFEKTNELNSPLRIACLLDDWLMTSSAMLGHVGQELRQLIIGVLRGLRWEMKALSDLVAYPNSATDLAMFSEQFRDILGWQVTASAKTAIATPEQQNELRHHYHALVQALRIIQSGAKRFIPTSLSDGEHDPASSLLITFIQLIQKLLGRLNRFGDKYLDFYYHDVLRMTPKGRQPDSAFLVIHPAPTTLKIEIEKGEEFIAGIDANQNEIIYETDQASTLNDATVCAINTLFFDQQRNLKNELEAQACYWRDIPVPSEEDAGTEYEKLPPWPLMGAPKPNKKPSGIKPSRFGFAITSKVLFLQEGDRKIHVFFQYASAPTQTIEAHLSRLAKEISDKKLGNSHHLSAIQENDVFVKLFRNMFRISVSTNEGWYEIPEYRPEFRGLNPNLKADCLGISIEVPASVPALVGLQTTLHGESFGSALPAIRFEMRQNEYYFPYDILKNCLLEEVRIEVEAKGCRQLLLHNQIGQLSAASPFLPFGPLPSVGAYFIVGYEEIIYKQLDNVEVVVEWGGLPQNLGGLAAHYRGYSFPLRSDSVLASTAVLCDGKWNDGHASIKLFQFVENSDGSKSNQVNATSLLSYQSTVKYHKPVPKLSQEKIQSAFSFTPSSMNGFFKLRLDEPEGSFGHQEYPQLLSRVLTQNSKIKKEFLLKPLPNPPYTPQISNIVLNYRAHTVINFRQTAKPELNVEQDKFIHLYPTGIETIDPIEHKTIYQIPRYDQPANVFIGLEATQLRGFLSLYFYLREDSLPMSQEKQCVLTWWYLSGNRWNELSKAQVMEDTTQGFMTSGIIKLNLPDDLSNQNTIMPRGLYWLRVSANHGMENFCSVYSIFAQAVKVTWRMDQANRELAILPANSISKSKRNIPGIRNIVQVRRSFGGKDQETRQQFRTRASERLRHKNRALNAADYELLILEHFPEIYKVKCFPNFCSAYDPAHRRQPGHILIVVLPYLNEGGHANQKPNLSGHLIYEIQRYITQFAPPDATISVENPVYEEIQVRCTIKLKTGFQEGQYSDQINQALCQYLSPWNHMGQSHHFGWRIQQHDIISFLLDLDYVDEVTAVSLLQIGQIGDPLDQRFFLVDSARKQSENAHTLDPVYPWSIAVPMNQHWIVIQDHPNVQPAKKLGINELKIGSTFIIPSRRNP